MNPEIYTQLLKPERAPPARLFGPVRSLLYALIIISFGFVGLNIVTKKRDRKVGIPFGINIIANILFTPLFFRWELIELATVDILVVLGTIVLMMIVTRHKQRRIALIQIPYFLRVMFATVLQISIVILN